MRKMLDTLEDSTLKHYRLEALNHIGYITSTIIAAAGLLNYVAFLEFAKTSTISIPLTIITALVLIIYFINETSQTFLKYNIQLRSSLKQYTSRKIV